MSNRYLAYHDGTGLEQPIPCMHAPDSHRYVVMHVDGGMQTYGDGAHEPPECTLRYMQLARHLVSTGKTLSLPLSVGKKSAEPSPLLCPVFHGRREWIRVGKEPDDGANATPPPGRQHASRYHKWASASSGPGLEVMGALRVGPPPPRQNLHQALDWTRSTFTVLYCEVVVMDIRQSYGCVQEINSYYLRAHRLRSTNRLTDDGRMPNSVRASDYWRKGGSAEVLRPINQTLPPTPHFPILQDSLSSPTSPAYQPGEPSARAGTLRPPFGFIDTTALRRLAVAVAVLARGCNSRPTRNQNTIRPAVEAKADMRRGPRRVSHLLVTLLVQIHLTQGCNPPLTNPSTAVQPDALCAESNSATRPLELFSQKPMALSRSHFDLTSAGALLVAQRCPAVSLVELTGSPRGGLWVRVLVQWLQGKVWTNTSHSPHLQYSTVHGSRARPAFSAHAMHLEQASQPQVSSGMEAELQLRLAAIDAELFQCNIQYLASFSFSRERMNPPVKSCGPRLRLGAGGDGRTPSTIAQRRWALAHESKGRAEQETEQNRLTALAPAFEHESLGAHCIKPVAFLRREMGDSPPFPPVLSRIVAKGICILVDKRRRSLETANPAIHNCQRPTPTPDLARDPCLGRHELASREAVAAKCQRKRKEKVQRLGGSMYAHATEETVANAARRVWKKNGNKARARGAF
ncbi:hypothetical protein HRG_014166 [Hirsutella rhossiliensis]